MVTGQMSIFDIPTQHCPRCDQDLPEDAYPSNKWGKRGHYCRACVVEYRRAWRLAKGIKPRTPQATPAPKPRKPRAYSNDYRPVHGRIQTAKGKASAYPCAHCQGNAHHWAYDHADPDEILGRTGGDRQVTAAYSLKPEHYQPLCRSCHAKEDRARSERKRIAELEREIAELRSQMSGFSPAGGGPDSPLDPFFVCAIGDPS